MDRAAIHDRYWNSHFASLGLCEKEFGQASGRKVDPQWRSSLHRENRLGVKNEETVGDASGSCRVFWISTAGLGD